MHLMGTKHPQKLTFEVLDDFSEAAGFPATVRVHFLELAVEVEFLLSRLSCSV